MEKLRDKKKHDHLLTKLLKAGIFSIVMLAPFFAILTKCLYILNPNAKDSYSSNSTEYYYSTITSTTQFASQKSYYVNLERYLNATNVGTISPTIKYTDISIDLTTYEDLNPYAFFLQNGSGYLNVTFVNSQLQYIFRIDYRLTSTGQWLRNDKTFTFTYDSIVANENNQLDNAFSEVIEKASPLSNAFYDAVNQLDEMPLFNWTKNTALYTTLNAMCSGLDIGTNILAILLTYWALMTAIYIVFDIIIELFTKITHILA